MCQDREFRATNALRKTLCYESQAEESGGEGRGVSKALLQGWLEVRVGHNSYTPQQAQCVGFIAIKAF